MFFHGDALKFKKYAPKTLTFLKISKIGLFNLGKPRVQNPNRSLNVWNEVDFVPLACEDGPGPSPASSSFRSVPTPAFISYKMSIDECIEIT